MGTKQQTKCDQVSEIVGVRKLSLIMVEHAVKRRQQITYPIFTNKHAIVSLETTSKKPRHSQKTDRGKNTRILQQGRNEDIQKFKQGRTYTRISQ